MAKKKMPVAEEPVKSEPVEEVKVTEIEQPKKETAKKIGVVTGCLYLNIRENPNISSKKLGELKALEEVTIRNAKDEEWYAVTTSSGVKGFCMKKFITIK